MSSLGGVSIVCSTLHQMVVIWVGLTSSFQFVVCATEFENHSPNYQCVTNLTSAYTLKQSVCACTARVYLPACSSSILAMSMCPFSRASCSGLTPSTWLLSTGEGWWCSKASTHSVLPWLHASCRGVQPAWSMWSTNRKQRHKQCWLKMKVKWNGEAMSITV